MLKKQAKKGVFRHFLEKFYQKVAFFMRALPNSALDGKTACLSGQTPEYFYCNLIISNSCRLEKLQVSHKIKDEVLKFEFYQIISTD